MQDFLARMTGKRVDVFCGGASSWRGEIVKVEVGVLHLKDEEGAVCYVAIEKIIAVWESRDASEHRAGFIGVVPNKS
ncbi:MAG TPA: MM0924 family protein [Pyrinomonadaceae bacterium]|nr:MM0924 family protein [Pyrinomonadaceae bacterium]